MEWKPGKAREEISSELQHHYELLIEEKMRAGLARADAEAAARRQLGNVTAVSQELRELRWSVRLEQLWQDLRFGARLLGKSPSFTAIAVLTIALGIGLNAAMFSVVNAVLLRPLPLPEPERLMFVAEKGYRGLSYATYRDYAERNTTFSSMSAWMGQSVNLTGEGEPERIIGSFVSSSFFDVVGVRPARGRGLNAGEDQPGAAPVVVITHGLWQRKFGGDANMLGRTLVLNGQPFTVVGIMPESFRFPMGEYDAYLPYWAYPNYNAERRDVRANVAIGRLRPGVRREQAEAELSALAAQIKQAHPNLGLPDKATVSSMQEAIVGDSRLMLWALLGATGLVLLIACANVANLLLARGSSRQREMVVRSALGAARGRILRQLLTEAVLLGAIGAAAGVLLAIWGVQGLRAMGEAYLPSYAEVALDRSVLLFAAGLALLTSVIFGAVPAIHLSGPDLAPTLNEGGRAPQAGRGRHRVRAALVVAQTALAVVLLVSTGLMLKSVLRLRSQDPGFNAEKLLTLEYRLPRNKYPEGEQQWQFHRTVLEQVRAVPGVADATIIRALPFSGNGALAEVEIPERPAAPGEQMKSFFNAVVPGTFEAMGIPLLRGRSFTEQDHAQAPLVVVVNKKFAERAWPGEDAIGKRIRAQNGPQRLEASVIGVVGDVKQYELAEELMPHVYTHYAQDPFIFATLVVRTKVEPMSLQDQVRQAVWSVDSQQPVWKIRTVEVLMDRSVGDRRTFLRLVATFAGLALVLAVIGTYGVMSWMVGQRTHEIGVRMALGARAKDVIADVLGRGMKLTTVGVVLGVAGALAAWRGLSSLLYGVSGADAPTFLVAVAALSTVAMLAVLVPARRATKVDPMVALRYE